MAGTCPDGDGGGINSPLLSDSVTLEIVGVEETNGFLSQEGREGNPFEFLGAMPPRPPILTTADPFRNHTPGWGGAYEWCKVVVCLPIAVLRLALFGLSIAVGYFATLIALAGWKDTASPMPRWRRRLMWVTRICARCILFSFGYQWIRIKGKPAPRELAPIVVSNHVCYVEPIFFFYKLCPTIVSAESHDSIPFVGMIIRAMQVIYVDRFSPKSRKFAVNEIKRKASCNSFPRVLLFPEGTTSNGRFLISFQKGAFVPGYPIQPVVVRYPYVHFDQSWGNITLVKLMFRMFTQFHNFMEVEYLPIIHPIKTEQNNALCFSKRTSNVMARALNVVQTSHSYVDMLLLEKAKEHGKENCSNYMVEMAPLKDAYDVTSSEALDLLEHFLAMNPDSNGRMGMHEFLEAFCFDSNPLLCSVFHFFDLENRGSITFRQFLIGSVHIRKQPLFEITCQNAFNAHKDPELSTISMQQLANILESTMPRVAADRVHRLFRMFDVDEDGAISRDDFMATLTRCPHLVVLFSDATQVES